MTENPTSDIKKSEDGRHSGRPHKDDSERAVRISITLTSDVLMIADRHKTAGDISMSEFIRRTIRYYDVNCVEASQEVNATRNTVEYNAAVELLGEKLEQMRLEGQELTYTRLLQVAYNTAMKFKVPIDKVIEDSTAQALKFRDKWKIQ